MNSGAEKYLALTHREGTSVLVIQQGAEPLEFTRNFIPWSDTLFEPFEDKSPGAPLKLVDFGLAMRLPRASMRRRSAARPRTWRPRS